MRVLRWDAGVLWWLGAGVVLLAVRVALNEFVPGLAHDSFQYLSVAEQALRGRFGATSLVHFDAERSFATVPAPLVTFPLGYPAAIALLGLTGMPLARAALFINVASALACVPLLWWMTGQLGMGRYLRHAVLACVVFNGAFLLFAATASTEMLFTVSVLGGVALLLRARLRDGPGNPWLWVAAGLVFGLAYHVRYAGLFVVVALAVLAVRHIVARDRALALGYAVSFAAAVTLVAVGMARNLILVGNWRGGNEKVVSNALSGVVEQTVRAANGLVLGPLSGASSESLVPRALFGVWVLLLAGLLFMKRQAPRQTVNAADTRVRGFSVDLLTILVVYTALMFYAALSTVISYGTRMFVPMIPLIALLVGLGVSALRPQTTASVSGWTRPNWALATTLLVYAVLNLLAFRVPLVDRSSPVIAQMDALTDTGMRVRDVIARYAGEGRVIVANNGQAIGYELGRPTISLVGPHYSNAVWDETAVHNLIDRYRAAVVVITAPNAIQRADNDLIPSPFVDSLARGESPAWLRLVSRAGSIFVYVPVSPLARS